MTSRHKYLSLTRSGICNFFGGLITAGVCAILGTKLIGRNSAHHVLVAKEELQAQALREADNDKLFADVREQASNGRFGAYLSLVVGLLLWAAVVFCLAHFIVKYW